jgi:hypothetical protein
VPSGCFKSDGGGKRGEKGSGLALVPNLSWWLYLAAILHSHFVADLVSSSLKV